jgi:hypothetical protein
MGIPRVVLASPSNTECVLSPPTIAGGGGSGPVLGVLPPILSKFVTRLPSTKCVAYVTKTARSLPMLKPGQMKGKRRGRVYQHLDSKITNDKPS